VPPERERTRRTGADSGWHSGSDDEKQARRGAPPDSLDTRTGDGVESLAALEMSGICLTTHHFSKPPIGLAVV